MKNLIVYFSWSNNTKNLVEDLNTEFKYDVVRVEREKPYSRDYNTCAYVEAKEEVEKHIHPAIKKLNVDFNSYDNILLFFPIWWYTFPMPIGTFVEELKDYKGKIYVFANSYTNDPKYMENSMRDLRSINKNINFVEGLFNKSTKNHIDFIKKIYFICIFTYL